MDPQLQAKIDEARANGYSDEEIQKYFLSEQTPSQDLRNQPTTDRREENTGLAQGILGKTAEYGIGSYGLYKAGQGIARAFGGGAPAPGPVAPTAAPMPAPAPAPAVPAPVVEPVAPAGSPQATMDILKAQNPQAANAAAQQAAGAAQQAEAAQITKAKQMVRQLAMERLMKASVGIGLMTASPSLNTNEDVELRRRRAMPPTITR